MWKTGLNLAKSLVIVLLLVALTLFFVELEGIFGEFRVWPIYSGQTSYTIYGLWSALVFGGAIVLVPLAICVFFSKSIMPTRGQKVVVLGLLGLLAGLTMLMEWRNAQSSNFLMTDFTLSPSEVFHHEVDVARKKRFDELKSAGIPAFCDKALENSAAEVMGNITVRGLTIPSEYKLTELLQEAGLSDHCQAHYKKRGESLFGEGRYASALNYYHLAMLLTPGHTPEYLEINTMYETLKKLAELEPSGLETH